MIAKWEEVCGVPFSEVEAFIAHREAMGGATDDDVIEKLKGLDHDPDEGEKTFVVCKEKTFS